MMERASRVSDIRSSPVRDLEPLPLTTDHEEYEDRWTERLEKVWAHRRALTRNLVWGIAIAALACLLIPNRYESTARIMPPDSEGTTGAMLAAIVGKASPALTSLASDFLGVKNTSALFISLLRSRTVQDHIVEHFQLQSVYWIRYKQDARKKLNDRTDVSEDRKSGVITIAVTDGNRQRARDMAQAYVDELDKLVAQVSTSAARRERMFIEQRRAQVAVELETAEKNFSQYASKHTLLDVKEETRAMVESGAVLQAQLIASQSELEGLQQIYTDNNVRVRALRARIAELQRHLQKIGGSETAASDTTPDPTQLYPSIKKMPLLGVEWADLYRQLRIHETVYELLTQQYELARIQEAKEIPVVRVIDSPNSPEKKAFPPRLLLISLFSAMWLAANVAWILAGERWNRIDPQDRRKVLATDVWRTTARHGDQVLRRFPIGGYADRFSWARKNGSKSPSNGNH
jgi:capsule polysaccharide export protein KpsE/RkpR